MPGTCANSVTLPGSAATKFATGAKQLTPRKLGEISATRAAICKTGTALSAE
jgi:hypothetical protein